MVYMPVTLTPSARLNGLQASSIELPVGWQRGIEVLVRSVPEPDRVNVCETSPGEPEAAGEVVQFTPVLIRQGVRCSMLGRPDTGAVARTVAGISGWYALSLEVYDGLATGNPSFADATSVGSSDSLCEAIGLIEQAAENNLYGGIATIHIPVGLSSCLGDAVVHRNNRLYTHAGNFVAIHGDGDTIYGTGQVWAAVGQVDVNTYDDRRINLSEGWADIAALAVFDPSFIVSVAVGQTSP